MRRDLLAWLTGFALLAAPAGAAAALKLTTIGVKGMVCSS